MTVPASVPFSSTIPVGSETVTGPVTDVPLSVNTHDIVADWPSTVSPVVHVPASDSVAVVGAAGLFALSLQPTATLARISTIALKTPLDITSADAKCMPVTAALSGRVALVTGSSRGIGAAIAVALAAEGADIVVHGRAPSAHASRTVDGIRALGRRAVAIFADISQTSETKKLIGESVAAFGAIDILVNNAAIARATPVDQLTLADWNEHVATNLTPVFVTIQALLPKMRERRWGRVINVSSIAAQARTVIGPHYAATKAGVLGLTRVYAGLVARDGVTVNAIAPALIETDMIADTPARPDMLPVNRFGRSEEVAAAAVLLATNGYITGQTINVNGGLYMG